MAKVWAKWRGWARRWRRGRFVPAEGLMLLCLLWTLGSVREEMLPGLVPDRLPRWEGMAVPFAVLTALAGLVSAARRRGWPRGGRILEAAGIGLGLFVAPAVLISASQGWVSGYARTVLLMLTPLFTVVFEPYIGGERDGRGVRGGLAAALAALAGAVCVFPVEMPGSVEAGVAFCGVMVAAGCVAAANCRAVVAMRTEARPDAGFVAMCGATALVGFGGLSALTERPVWGWAAIGPELLWAAVVEVPGLLLLFWLMRRMAALRMSTRYVFAPLVTILFGVLWMWPPMRFRTWAGLALMIAGAGYLLVAPEREEERPGLSLR